MKVTASVKYTVMEGRSSREGFKRCANHLESSSRPTPRTSLKGTPSLIVDLAPLLVLRAASSYGHLTYRTYIKNRTPTDVLDGKAPREVWVDKKVGSLLHMHESGALAFKHVEARFKSNKLAARAKKLQLVRYNTRNITYQLWDSAQPHKTTNSAELSFREKETRDVVPPKAGYDPFPEPGKIIHQPRSTETKEEENEDEETVGPAPQAQQQRLRRSGWQRKAPDVLNLHTCLLYTSPSPRDS